MAGFLSSLFNPDADTASPESSGAPLYNLDGEPVNQDSPRGDSDFGNSAARATDDDANAPQHTSPAGAPTNDYLEPQSGGAHITDTAE